MNNLPDMIEPWAAQRYRWELWRASGRCELSYDIDDPAHPMFGHRITSRQANIAYHLELCGQLTAIRREVESKYPKLLGLVPSPDPGDAKVSELFAMMRKLKGEVLHLLNAEAETAAALPALAAWEQAALDHLKRSSRPIPAKTLCVAVGVGVEENTLMKSCQKGGKLYMYGVRNDGTKQGYHYDASQDLSRKPR